MLSTKVMYAIGKDIQELIRSVMKSNEGINKKVGINTLVDSDIYNELYVHATNDGDLVFDFILNDYLIYIESGRRKGARIPPVEPIERWYRKKFGETPDNNTLWAIRKAISRDGIKARPFMAKVMDACDALYKSRWADDIFDEIIKQLNKFFS